MLVSIRRMFVPPAFRSAGLAFQTVLSLNSSLIDNDNYMKCVLYCGSPSLQLFVVDISFPCFVTHAPRGYGVNVSCIFCKAALTKFQRPRV